ncbi:MAG: DUF2845 domain-containing protein [Steroidobacter sp.]
MRLPALYIIAVLLLPASAVADSMRCGKWVVNEQSSVAELREKCGAPLDKTSKTEDNLAVNAAGYAFKTGTSTTTEQWFYQRSSQSFRMIVTIVDNVIKSIERAE